MRKMGAAGAAIGSISVAGCAGGETTTEGGGGGGGGSQGSDARVIEDDVSEERMMDDVIHLAYTEQYNPGRYQANRLLDGRLTDEMGIPTVTDPVEATVVASREEAGEYDLVTYRWSPNNGEPDSIIVPRFATDGSENWTGFSSEEYDEVAYAQRQETDREARQELVYEAQDIIGEQRPETQLLHNEYFYAFNSDRFEEDSVVVTDTGLRNIWNYTQIEPKNEEGQTIVTNNWDPSDQLNPLNANAIGPSRNWTPTRFMHDFLIRTGPDLEAQPWAATDWEFEDDTTVTFQLREDMTFHDGEPVTASDVAWTYQMMLDLEPPAYLNNVVQVVESVEQVDEYTVTINLQEPYVPFIKTTAGIVPILPEHYWTQLMEETGTTEQPWRITINDDNPVVGSGPFQWGTWDQGSRFEMPSFDDHFMAPNIDMRIQRPLSTSDAEQQAMINGDYDLLDYWFGDTQQLAATVEENDFLSGVETLGTGRQSVWVNCQRPPFDNVPMRQAFNAVVRDTQSTVISEAFDGYGQEAYSFINPSLGFWHNEETTRFDGGIEEATTILADAGYVWDSDGNIYYPEGMTGK